MHVSMQVSEKSRVCRSLFKKETFQKETHKCVKETLVKETHIYAKRDLDTLSRFVLKSMQVSKKLEYAGLFIQKRPTNVTKRLS